MLYGSKIAVESCFTYRTSAVERFVLEGDMHFFAGFFRFHPEQTVHTLPWHAKRGALMCADGASIQLDIMEAMLMSKG